MAVARNDTWQTFSRRVSVFTDGQHRFVVGSRTVCRIVCVAVQSR